MAECSCWASPTNLSRYHLILLKRIEIIAIYSRNCFEFIITPEAIYGVYYNVRWELDGLIVKNINFYKV